MIARTFEQSLQDALSPESVALSRVAVVEPGEPPGIDESPSWGVLTSMPSSAVARRWRSEPRPHAHARQDLAHQNHQNHQNAAQQRPPVYLLAIEQFWRHAIPGCGVARLLCRQCGREVVVPVLLRGARLLPIVQDVSHCRHGAVADRWRPATRVDPATRASSGLAAGRARLMGARLPAPQPSRRTQ